MELASIIFGFIIAFFMYRRLDLNSKFGILGWFTIFWILWGAASVSSCIVMLLIGSLAKWILPGVIILFVISEIRRK